MTTEQKEEIVALMQSHVKEHERVNVSWAAQQILRGRITGDILEKLSIAIIKTNKYIREPDRDKYDWVIRLNPLYKETKWFDKHPVWKDILVGFIAAAFSLGVGILLWLIDKQSVDQKQEQLQRQVKVLSDRLDSLTSQQTVSKDTLLKK